MRTSWAVGREANDNIQQRQQQRLPFSSMDFFRYIVNRQTAFWIRTRLVIG